MAATGTVSMDKLSDGQIAAVLSAVDEAEIAQAQVALKRATNPPVREFAKHMVDEHTASMETGEQLVSQAGLKAGESPKSKELKAAGARMLERLDAAEEANFDITYLSGQIEQHAAVLQLIEDQLLPAVNEPALRSHVNDAQRMVQQHLDMARKIQKK